MESDDPLHGINIKYKYDLKKVPKLVRWWSDLWILQTSHKFKQILLNGYWNVQIIIDHEFIKNWCRIFTKFVRRIKN